MICHVCSDLYIAICDAPAIIIVHLKNKHEDGTHFKCSAGYFCNTLLLSDRPLQVIELSSKSFSCT
jgi:hypothetical protein